MRRRTKIFALLLLAPIFPSNGAFANSDPVLQSADAASGAEDPESFCQKSAGGQVPGIKFKLFDRSWRYPEWEASKQRLQAKCLAWNQQKQDSAAISELVKERNTFAQLSLRAPDKMLEAAIQKLGPARNQKDTPTCFAHAVADIATYLTGQPVSAFSVAIRSFQKISGLFAAIKGLTTSKDRYSYGGLTENTLAAIQKGTLCRDDQSRDNLTYNASDLRGVYQTYQNEFRPYVGPQRPEQIINRIQNHVSRLAPSLNANDFVKHMSSFKHIDDALGEWFDRNCNIRVPSFRIMRERESKSIARALEVALDNHSIALISWDTTPFLKNQSEGGGPNGHLSEILALAEIEGKKHFLVRNSWGSSCGPYSASIQKNCKAGHFWVSEGEIVPNITAVHFVK